MTELLLQKLHVPDCESAIERAYFDWGRGWPEDSPEPDWDRARPEQRLAIARRGYLLYDGWPPSYGNEIGPIECYVSVGINSRVILNDVVRFVVRAHEATELLAQIPNDARLEDATEDQIEAAARLIDLFDAVPKLGRSKVTKVLYKKRPAFIPVIDSVVDDFLWKNFPHLITSESSTENILSLYQLLLVARARPLHAVQSSLAARGFAVSTGRIVSHLIWMNWSSRMRADMTGPLFREVWGTGDMWAVRQRAREEWERQAHDGTCRPEGKHGTR